MIYQDPITSHMPPKNPGNGPGPPGPGPPGPPGPIAIDLQVWKHNHWKRGLRCKASTEHNGRDGFSVALEYINSFA